MKKRLFALLAAAALVLSLWPAAFAAEESDVRQTGFFTDENAQRRTDMTFEELSEYLFHWYNTEFDYWNSSIAAAHEILELAQDGDNAAAVREKLLELDEEYINCRAASQAGYIRYYQTWEDDYWNDYWVGSYGFAYNLWYLLAGVSGRVLQSPCAAAAEELIPAKADREDYTANGELYLDWSYYTYYFPAETTENSETGSGTEENPGSNTGEEYVDPSDADSALVDEYNEHSYDDFTTVYNGTEWTSADVTAAQTAGQIDSETANRLNREIQKNRNAYLGGLFVEALAYRQQVAEDYGYDNYMAYLYDYSYSRDYTYTEIQTYADALKTYIAPVYQALSAIPYETSDAFYVDYAGELGMDLIQPYIGRMSSELLESFTYMRRCHMADTGWSDFKGLSTNSTMPLYGYGTGFILGDPAIAYDDNQLYNFDMIVHEFGHFNGNYWNDCTGGFFNYRNKPDYNIDICEVQSQGLELLMTRYYPEIFAGEAGDVTLYKMSGELSTLLLYAQYNEFETYAYTTPGVTLQQLNEKWLQLGIAYGFVDPDTPYTENYNWVTNPQLFHSPGYGISYSVSLAGSFPFWLKAQEDFFAGVDEYLEFCALPSDLTFQESFERIGANPLSPAFVEELAENLTAALGLDGPKFYDVDGQWYAPAVLALAGEGLVSGYDDGTFQPDAPAVFGMIDAGSSLADAAITRLEACRLLAQELGLELDGDAVSPFPDTNDGVVAALARLGVISGYPDGTFQPDQHMTRAELCVVWYLMRNI